MEGELKGLSFRPKKIRIKQHATLSLPGLPQPAEGPHHGGPGHRASGHGHPHPGRARPHGGRPPDADPLDPQDHRGGGTHGAAAGAHPAPHRAALQGEPSTQFTEWSKQMDRDVETA